MGLGNQTEAHRYMTYALQYANDWSALDWNGLDHFRLEYDANNASWSQKYNLFWSFVIGIDELLFGQLKIRDIELAYYQTRLNPFGLPLDNRGVLAKLDSSMWVAAMTRGNTELREAIVNSLYTFAHATPSRIPLSDVYDTTTNKAVLFTGRPVLGGLSALDLFPNSVVPSC